MKAIFGSRRHHYVVAIAIFLIVLALIAGTVGCGSNPPLQEGEIRTWYDLDAIRNDLCGTYILMNDLNSATAGYEQLAGPTANEGNGWLPIGRADIAFNGTFDGQDYEIGDLCIMGSGVTCCLGLFGVVGWDGVIKTIGVVNASISGWSQVGGVAGLSYGTVISSYCSGHIGASAVAGGLVGENVGGTVTDSYSTCNVDAEVIVGGLVGVNYDGTVSDSYSSGDVLGTMFSTGGLLGRNDGGNVTDSYSTGIVSGNQYVGGLVGDNREGTVSNCYALGSVAGTSNVGGLIGLDDHSVVSNSFWDTQTSGQPTSAGGTGKTTAEMQDIATFSGASWNITTVANPDIRNLAYIWNIVEDATYPFLSWQPVS